MNETLTSPLPTVVDDICQVLRQQNNFLIVNHITPDGDAIGSAVALGEILQRLGKSFRLYNYTGVPDDLAWACPWPVATSLRDLANFKPEVCITVDCGDSNRVGPELEKMLLAGHFPISINLDHHRDNPLFATYNWVDPSMAAAAIMVGLLAKKLNLELSGKLGQAVYLGLVTDTGSFSYANTDSRCFALAGEIVGLGLDVGEFNTCLTNTWSMTRMRFWGKLFNEIKLAEHGAIAYVTVSATALAKAGLLVDDLSDFSSWMRRIKGTLATAMIRESEMGRAKVSLRSASNVNVQKVAAHFGGGGHINAAAFECEASLDEAVEKLLPLLVQELAQAQLHPPLQSQAKTGSQQSC